MTIAPPAASPHTAVIGPRACITCGYNLQGLSVSGVCPECGTPTADSLRGVLLQFASPEYIATVRQGHSWVLNGILVQVGVVLCMLVSAIAWSFNTSVLTAGSFAFLGVAIFVYLGYLKLTTPDPQFQGEEKPDSARNVVRYAVISLVGILTLQIVVGSIPAIPAMKALPAILEWAHVAATAVQLFAMMRYTLWLARRVPDALLIRLSKRYAWLLPLLQMAALLKIPLVALASLLALVLYWSILHRMRKHLQSIEQTGAPASLPRMA